MTTPEEIQEQHGQSVPPSPLKKAIVDYIRECNADEPKDIDRPDYYDIVSYAGSIGFIGVETQQAIKELVEDGVIETDDLENYMLCESDPDWREIKITTPEVKADFKAFAEAARAIQSDVNAILATPADIATREEVDRLKADWLACAGDFDIVPDSRFDLYADELRAFEQAENARWEREKQERADRWFAQFKSNFYYQLSLDEMNKIVERGYRVNVIAATVLEEREEYGYNLELERISQSIVYTVQMV